MNELKSILKQYNLTSEQITKCISFYKYAIENNIPFPIYYAISKLVI